MRAFKSFLKNNAIALDGYTTSASITTDAMRVEHINNFTVQGTATSTLTGTLKLQCSCDNGPEMNGDTAPPVVNWVDIAGATATLSSSAATIFNVADAGYRWVRAVYTVASGSGNLTLRFNGKGTI